MRAKNERVEIRISDVIKRKLTAICEVENKTKTKVIEELIFEKYKKSKKYEDKYYEFVNKIM